MRNVRSNPFLLPGFLLPPLLGFFSGFVHFSRTVRWVRDGSVRTVRWVRDDSVRTARTARWARAGSVRYVLTGSMAY